MHVMLVDGDGLGHRLGRGRFRLVALDGFGRILCGIAGFCRNLAIVTAVRICGSRIACHPIAGCLNCGFVMRHERSLVVRCGHVLVDTDGIGISRGCNENKSGGKGRRKQLQAHGNPRVSIDVRPF